MGFGNSISVNLDKYFDVLARAGVDGGEGLKAKLAEYGVKGSTTFYQGPEVGDGVILVKYKADGANQGVLRFSDQGKLFDVLSGKEVYRDSSKVWSLFVAGLFGNEELSSNLDKYDAIVSSGIEAARGCFDLKRGTKCNIEVVTTAVTEANTVKAKDAEIAQVKREKEAIEAERRHQAYLKQEIDTMLTLIGDMTKWAEKEDAGPGGIDPDHITDVMKKYNFLQYIERLEKKRDLLKEAIVQMIKTYSVEKYMKAHNIREHCTVTSRREEVCNHYCGSSERYSGPYSIIVEDKDCYVKFPGIDEIFSYGSIEKSESCGECKQMDRRP